MTSLICCFFLFQDHKSQYRSDLASVQASIHNSRLVRFHEAHRGFLLEMQDEHRGQGRFLYTAVSQDESGILGRIRVHHRRPAIQHWRYLNTVHPSKLQQTFDLCDSLGQAGSGNGASIRWSRAVR